MCPEVFFGVTVAHSLAHSTEQSLGQPVTAACTLGAPDRARRCKEARTMYLPNATRYQEIPYVRCGRSGLRLPRISLGLWQNFGGSAPFESAREMVLRSFDRGITHFDLANNYGPPPGSAEENLAAFSPTDLAGYRDELVISTKAGYLMWPGPYGEWGSRKYVLASLDQSLRAHGPRLCRYLLFPPLRPEYAAGGNHGRARYGRTQRPGLYVGISSYGPEKTREAAAILRELKTPFIIHQPSYSMLNRWIEKELLEVLQQEGLGCIAFSPLAQGLLTTKYLGGIPDDSRAAENGSFQKTVVNERNLANVRALNDIAQERGQSLAQMAIAWVLRQAGRHQRPDRRQPLGADRGMSGRPEESAVQRRGAGADRPSRARWRPEYLGRIERARVIFRRTCAPSGPSRAYSSI